MRFETFKSNLRIKPAGRPGHEIAQYDIFEKIYLENPELDHVNDIHDFHTRAQYMFPDFYDMERDYLDAAHDDVDIGMTIGPHPECEGWHAPKPIDGYTSVDCLICGQQKILFKNLPKITRLMKQTAIEQAEEIPDTPSRGAGASA